LSNPKWDAFICHASEDKDEIARPLAENLRNRGFRIWYDEFILHVGDALMEKINFGLKDSAFGIVILSKNFSKKSWPKKELEALNSKAMIGTRKIILPVWHEITSKYVNEHFPMLAGLVAVPTKIGIENVAEKLEKAIKDEQNSAEYIHYESAEYNNGYRMGAVRAQEDIYAFENGQLSGLSGSRAPPCPLPTNIEFCKGWEKGYTDQVMYRMD
jgi:hypothetical protein